MTIRTAFVSGSQIPVTSSQIARRTPHIFQQFRSSSNDTSTMILRISQPLMILADR